MRSLKLLGLAAGLAALAACGKNDDTTVNADLNATSDNLVMPADNMTTNVDMNDTNMTNDTNATGNNTSDNTTNAY